jgi:hypothetical protein
MSDYSIVDFRINGERYYLVEKENKVSFYTTNIAAARYWIRSEMNDPTLIRPFQDPIPLEVDNSEVKEAINDMPEVVKQEVLEEQEVSQEVPSNDHGEPKATVRIS